MTALKLAQQLYRAAKRMTHAQIVATGSRDGVYTIRVHAEDGAIYDVTITTHEAAP